MSKILGRGFVDICCEVIHQRDDRKLRCQAVFWDCFNIELVHNQCGSTMLCSKSSPTETRGFVLNIYKRLDLYSDGLHTVAHHIREALLLTYSHYGK